jgi:phosphoribosylglycinamide formyltransferase-1
MKKLAIFVSGSGTNMENLILKIREQKLPYEPAVVICDKPGAKALERAGRLGVKTELVDRKLFASKELFEKAIVAKLESCGIELIALAGFMRILSSEFVQSYQGRLINIHPSYLPNFVGGHAIRDAFEAKAKETGVTVHHVVAEVDSGPIIIQRKVPILPQDTLETLEARVHAAEYELYPEALKIIAQNS